MAIYLSHESAVEMLCYLRTLATDLDEDGVGTYTTDWCVACTKTLSKDCIHTVHQLRRIGKEATELLSHLSRPLHVLVRSKDQVVWTKELHPHLWTGDVGRKAFIDLGNGVYLSMPAFTFVQMATELSLTQLIMLGMMFCGYYAPGPQFGRSEKCGTLDTPLTSLHKQMVCSADVFELEPICSEHVLARFINNHPHIHGSNAAQSALPWVRNTSASHMESALYLLLCLPVRMGGYGLPKPLLNPLVRVEQASGARICYPDLYWKGASIDMEYSSDWAHTGVSANYLDSRRLTAIVCNDIDYLSITSGQLRRPNDMDDAARGLARKLRHRIRYTGDGWKEKRTQLRLEVLPKNFEKNAKFDGVDDTQVDDPKPVQR